MFHPTLQKFGNCFITPVAILSFFTVLHRRSWAAVSLYSTLWILHWTTMSAEYPTLCMKPLTALMAPQHLFQIPSDSLVSPDLFCIFSPPTVIVCMDIIVLDWITWMLNGTFFFHLNRSTQLLSEFYLLALRKKKHYFQNCTLLIFLPILFHHWNLSGINVIPNPACRHSTSCLLQSGQFLFYQSRH